MCGGSSSNSLRGLGLAVLLTTRVRGFGLEMGRSSCSDRIEDFLRHLKTEILAVHAIEFLSQGRQCFLVHGQERLFLGKSVVDATVELLICPRC